jgi:eukaryotic-like serine/threonine-protein kinase
VLGTILEDVEVVDEQALPIPRTPDAAAQPSPGMPLFNKDDVLDNTYRVVEGIAAGGMGEVYRAVHLRLPRALAIKTLQPEFAARPEWVARFCREACVLAQLHHPNIVQVLDFNVAPNGVPYIAMELIEGRDLRAELDSGRRFDAIEVVSIVQQIASALDAAHAAGVVHRDLKPENVVLTPAPGQRPVVKVIDFGLSMCGWSERVTGVGAVFGTPDYMAPEQAQGQRDQMDARTDQFALAALTYTLLSGRAPFARETPVAVLYAIVHEPPAALGTVEGWDLEPVERVLRRGMARERDDRFPSVLAFAEALEEALVEGGALPRPTTPAPLRLVPSPERSMERSSADLRPVRRRSPVGRAVFPMVLISLLIAGAVWGGMVNGRASGTRASWRGDVGTVRATVSSEWQRLAGQVARAATGPAQPRGPQP